MYLRSPKQSPWWPSFISAAVQVTQSVSNQAHHPSQQHWPANASPEQSLGHLQLRNTAGSSHRLCHWLFTRLLMRYFQIFQFGCKFFWDQKKIAHCAFAQHLEQPAPDAGENLLQCLLQQICRIIFNQGEHFRLTLLFYKFGFPYHLILLQSL